MSLMASRDFLRGTKFFSGGNMPKSSWHDRLPNNWIRVHAADPNDTPLKSAGGKTLFQFSHSKRMLRDEAGIATPATSKQTDVITKEYNDLANKHRDMGGVLAAIDPETGHVHHHDGTVTDMEGKVLRGGGEGHTFALSQPHTLVGDGTNLGSYGTFRHPNLELDASSTGYKMTGRIKPSTQPGDNGGNNPPDLSGDPKRVVDPRI